MEVTRKSGGLGLKATTMALHMHARLEKPARHSDTKSNILKCENGCWVRNIKLNVPPIVVKANIVLIDEIIKE